MAVEKLTGEQLKIFADAIQRRNTLEKLRRDNTADAETLENELKGTRVYQRGVTYEIVYVSTDYNGGFKARGYRILKDGKRGSKIWDFGRLYPACFEVR